LDRGNRLAGGAVQICILPRLKVTKFTSKRVFLSPFVTFGENEGQAICTALFFKVV
jgi:hypothetical protein